MYQVKSISPGKVILTRDGAPAVVESTVLSTLWVCAMITMMPLFAPIYMAEATGSPV